MTVHYSAYGLNTNCGSTYFQSQIPEDYPLHPTLQKCRAFRRLPLNLKELGLLANRWVARHDPDRRGNIDQWYDSDGYELNPNTGERLTDAEIDADWQRWPVPDIEVRDIPRPPGGFADPDTWQEPHVEQPDLVDRSGLTETQILSDIQSRGRAATADAYGVSQKTAAALKTDRELAHAILGMHGRPWPQDSTE